MPALCLSANVRALDAPLSRRSSARESSSRGSSSRRPHLLLALLSAAILFTPRTGTSEETPPANDSVQATAPSDAGASAVEQVKKARRSEEVVVTATRSEQSPEDVSMSVTLVPCTAIETTPSRTLDDALRTV